MKIYLNYGAQHQSNAKNTSMAEAITQIFRCLFPEGTIVFAQCDDDDLFEEETSQDNCPCTDYGFNHNHQQEPSFDRDNMPEFLSDIINQEYDDCFEEEEEDQKQIQEQLQDRITANVLRVVKDYLNYRLNAKDSGNDSETVSSNQFNGQCSNQSNGQCSVEKGSRTFTQPTCGCSNANAEQARNGNQNCGKAQIHTNATGVAYKPVPNALVRETASSSNPMMPQTSTHMCQSSSEGSQECAAEAVSSGNVPTNASIIDANALKEMERNITEELKAYFNDNIVSQVTSSVQEKITAEIKAYVQQNILPQVTNNLTDYADILLEEGFRRLERQLLERLTDRVDLRCMASAQNFLAEAIEKGLGDKVNQVLEERVTDNVIDKVSEVVYRDFQDYMDNEVPTILKGYVKDVVKKNVDELIPYIDDYSECVLEDGLSRIENAMEQCMNDFRGQSLESSVLECLSKSFLKEGDNPLVEKFVRDLAKKALKLIRNELKDYLTPAKESVEKLAVLQAMDCIKDAVEECVSEKLRCDKYYRCDLETDLDYECPFDDAADQDPYDDNDDLFEDDELLKRLYLNDHQPMDTESPFDSNSPLANKSSRERFYSESCGLCDPISGRSVRDNDSKKPGVGYNGETAQSNL